MSALWADWRRRDYVALGLAGGFLLIFIVEWLSSGFFEAAPYAPPATLADAPTPTSVPPDSEDRDYAVMAARPLFIDTRRSYVPPSAAATAPASPPEPLTLLATVLTEGHQVALVQAQRDNRIQKLGVGETVSGWTVVEVYAGYVTLRRGNETRRLDLVVKPGEKLPTVTPRNQDAEQ